jgi:hypothetical protein
MEQQYQNLQGDAASKNTLPGEDVRVLQKQVRLQSVMVLIFSVIVGFFGFFVFILASAGPRESVMLIMLNLFICIGLPIIAFLMSGVALVLLESEHSLHIAKILSQISKWIIILMIAIPLTMPILAIFLGFFGGIWMLIQRIF